MFQLFNGAAFNAGGILPVVNAEGAALSISTGTAKLAVNYACEGAASANATTGSTASCYRTANLGAGAVGVALQVNQAETARTCEGLAEASSRIVGVIIGEVFGEGHAVGVASLIGIWGAEIGAGEANASCTASGFVHRAKRAEGHAESVATITSEGVYAQAIFEGVATASANAPAFDPDVYRAVEGRRIAYVSGLADCYALGTGDEEQWVELRGSAEGWAVAAGLYSYRNRRATGDTADSMAEGTADCRYHKQVIGLPAECLSLAEARVVAEFNAAGGVTIGLAASDTYACRWQPAQGVAAAVCSALDGLPRISAMGFGFCAGSAAGVNTGFERMARLRGWGATGSYCVGVPSRRAVLLGDPAVGAANVLAEGERWRGLSASTVAVASAEAWSDILRRLFAGTAEATAIGENLVASWTDALFPPPAEATAWASRPEIWYLLEGQTASGIATATGQMSVNMYQLAPLVRKGFVGDDGRVVVVSFENREVTV